MKFTLMEQQAVQGGLGTSIWTSDEQLLAAVNALGYTRNSCSGVVTVEDPEDHPRLEAAFALIREHLGMERSVHKIVRVADRAKFFAVNVEYSFTAADVREAPLLRAFPRHAIATIKEQLPDETFVVEADKRLRENKCGIGNLYLTYMGCDEPSMQKLESAGFRGLTFRPILVDPPGRCPKKLWAPWSDLHMPECLWPLVDGLGEPFAGDYSKSCFYDTPDIGARPKWRREDVAGMGEFDVALSRERNGQTFKIACRHFIVSQHFREKCAALGIKDFVFIPLELV